MCISTIDLLYKIFQEGLDHAWKSVGLELIHSTQASLIFAVPGSSSPLSQPRKSHRVRLNHWQVLVFGTKISRLRLVSDTTLAPLWRQQWKKVTWPVWVTICVFKECALGGRRYIRCFYLEHGFKKKYRLPSPTNVFSKHGFQTSSTHTPGACQKCQCSGSAWDSPTQDL